MTFRSNLHFDALEVEHVLEDLTKYSDEDVQQFIGTFNSKVGTQLLCASNIKAPSNNSNWKTLNTSKISPELTKDNNAHAIDTHHGNC